MCFKLISENINGRKETFTVWKDLDTWVLFDTYFQNEKCRIFFITNIIHYYYWLKENQNNIRDNDYFFIYMTYFHSDSMCRQASNIIDSLKLNKSNFIHMCGDYCEMQHLLYYGFNNSILFNHNALLNENLINIKQVEKIYDAILISRAIPWKRIHLANKINNLAFFTSDPNRKEVEFPNHVNKNISVPYNQINDYINQSKCGLILSEIEGACYSSSEYLLAGIPVVSTVSYGGRDLWYTEENSIICDATEDSVKNSVDQILSRKINPQRIRDKHILLMNHLRSNFINEIDRIFKIHNINIDSRKYFNEKYYTKMNRYNILKKCTEILKNEE